GDGPPDSTPGPIANPDVDEDVALAGQIGFRPAEKILGSHVTIDGIRLPYVFSDTSLPDVAPLGTFGTNLAAFPLTAGPGPIVYPPLTLGGVTGELRIPIIADPSGVALPNTAARLTAAEITNILAAAARRGGPTRPGAR